MTELYPNMAFENYKTKEAQSWIRFISAKITQGSEVVILGLGSGEHIHEFQKHFPHITITIVDPRRQNFDSFKPHFNHNSLKYISTLEGVRLLAASLQRSPSPIPLLEFRPCWYPESIFFRWAQRTLLGYEEWNEWNETRAQFILESLLV